MDPSISGIFITFFVAQGITISRSYLPFVTFFDGREYGQDMFSFTVSFPALSGL